jgi:phosphatidylethanolamine-binding protein (PEBP) family uncharacterized protein
MSAVLKFLEYCLGVLFYRRRAYDDGIFYKSTAFKNQPKPTIPIESPNCGKTGAALTNEYSKFGSGRIPQLKWSSESVPPTVKEFLLLCEDPDAPMGEPNVHGIYCFIPPTVTSFGPRDLELIDERDGVKRIASGYRVGKNRRNIVYIAPRPLMGHGPHRYLFELVGLSEKLNASSISNVPTKTEIEKAIEGKVAAWGLWEAIYESTWDRDRIKL